MTRVLSSHELVEGKPRVVTVDGVNVALFRVGAEILACEDYCPHRGGPLSEGEVSGTTVTCPWHGARFDLRSGECLAGPGGRKVRSFLAADDGAYVSLRSVAP